MQGVAQGFICFAMEAHLLLKNFTKLDVLVEDVPRSIGSQNFNLSFYGPRSAETQHLWNSLFGTSIDHIEFRPRDGDGL